MVVFEESLIFFPDPYPSGMWDTDAVARASGNTLEDCFFTASDGARLHAWWCRPPTAAAGRGPTSDTVLLWFHGNAGNLAHRADMMLDLASIPAQVFIVDYRGYGRSEGRPNERGLSRDADAAWRFLTVERGIAADRIVLFGKSLGGAVAIDLATRVTPAGLIAQSSFTSVPAMAAHHYPFVPKFLVRTKMDNLSKIGGLDCPIMVIHSPADEVVPYDHGRRLFEAAGGDKRFFEVPHAGHNETWLVGGADYLDAIREFLVDCRPTQGER
jgi:fermentation-respiration switch protein FrsA (DUF1100 family)